MSRKLSKKARGFVNAYAETGNGTQSALQNYDTEDENVAAVIASENIRKPQIIEELRKLGFDSNNAKRVVGEIMNDEAAEHRDRLKAAELTFKVEGDMAPERHINLNIEQKIISIDE